MKVCTALILTGAVLVAESTYVMEVFSHEYQQGAYPYISIDGKIPGKVENIKECMDLCENNPQCFYGTMVTAGANLPGGTHAYSDTAAAGECWLSMTNHKTTTHCGVACTSFKKVIEADAADLTTPAPYVPDKSALVNDPALRTKGICHVKNGVKQCSMSCHCDPFTHPSAYTKCRLDPFTNKIQVYHLEPKFHTRPYHPTTQHHCKHHHAKDKACSCCSCDSLVGVHSFVGVGIGRHIVDTSTTVVPGGLISPGEKDYFVAKSIEDCERQCSELSYREEQKFVPITKAGVIEQVEDHSLLDCQARCDAHERCAFISIDKKTGKCGLLTLDATVRKWVTPANPDQATLKKLDAASRCNGGTYLQSGTLHGRCYLARKLMSEADCLSHEKKCLCDNDMGCSSFRRRPNQFTTIDDNSVFTGDNQLRYMKDCGAVGGEHCFDYPGCTAGGEACRNHKNFLPAWFTKYYIAGSNQCCGAGFTCHFSAASGEAICQRAIS